MKIGYDEYYDKVLGGWLGKCIGGTIGDRFEGDKRFIEIDRQEMFPARVPPNDDLDLQVLWLKVIEERGPHLTSDDIARAWMEGCWYPFNEYGIFRRNYALGIKPPMSGRYGNRFWETGMGCPIRSEIWGYAFPGAPDLAAEYARRDGVVDHTEQSVGAERMLAAMASMAFFVDDWKLLAHRYMHYLPAGSPVERLTREAFRAHGQGLELADARERILLLAGTPEACDVQINLPFTFLGLLYGENDLEETMLASLRCGYDTDCTMATAGAFLGQILGASNISKDLKDGVGDELVMGIQYERDEMLISTLARDTTRVGTLMGRALNTGIDVTDAPDFAPFPDIELPDATLAVTYEALPAAAPGDWVRVRIDVTGPARVAGTLRVGVPAGWRAYPESAPVLDGGADFTLHAVGDGPLWPYRHGFEVEWTAEDGAGRASETFGIAGAGLWKLLAIGYDAVPYSDELRAAPDVRQRAFNHHFIDPDRQYLPEPPTDVDGPWRRMSALLGRPAVIASYENEVDLAPLIGLSGVYTAYLAREIVVPKAQDVWLAVGHTDAYRLWVNGEEVARVDEPSAWSPFNRQIQVRLVEGANTVVVKLYKRSDHLRWTLGVRKDSTAGERARDYRWSMNAEDWVIDVADAVPA